jgi:hypothetical protein
MTNQMRLNITKADIQILNRRHGLQYRTLMSVTIGTPVNEQTKHQDRQRIDGAVPPL